MNFKRLIIFLLFITLGNLAFAYEETYLFVKSSNGKRNKIYESEAHHWPLFKLDRTNMGGEDEEARYQYCYVGNPRDIIPILEKMLNAQSKKNKSFKRELKINAIRIDRDSFDPDIAQRGTIYIDLGWASTGRSTQMRIYSECN